MTFNTAAAATQSDNTRWRLVKAYQPVSVTTAVPGNVSLGFTNQGVALGWAANGSLYYNLYRSSSNGGPYLLLTRLATTNFVDTAVSTNSLPEYYVVTGLNAFGDESGYSAQVAATPAARWRQEWFGTIANTGSAADTADPAGDGILNLLKRAFNLNPLLAETTGIPFGTLNGGVFTLTYQQSLAATDLNFLVESSPDLVNWTTTHVTDVVVSSNGGTAIHNASIPVAGNTQFLRVLVTPTE